MKRISHLDPSIASSNMGDQIISHSIDKILDDLFKSYFRIKFQTQDVIRKSSYDLIRNSDLKLLCGTNLLSSNMNSYRQWKIGIRDLFYLREIILMGVGWWQYQDKPNLYTNLIYHSVLSKEGLHSVRDEYTKKKLNSIGIRNVINTSCPTMWLLTEEHCTFIPHSKSDSVLLTLTNYKQDQKFDLKLIEILSRKYSQIYYWPQHFDDYAWAKKIASGLSEDKIIFVDPTLAALDEILKLDIDYVGTRLHAGIRALQSKKRSLIIAVDNRAEEIAKDTNLPVINRYHIDKVSHWIDNSLPTTIQTPEENILLWKSQFICR